MLGETSLVVLRRIAALNADSSDQAASLEPILEILAKELALEPTSITLIDPEGERASIEAAYGLSGEERRAGRYRRGEGITGQVLATGEAIVVPSVRAERDFLDRTGAYARGADASFICVPILAAGRVVGTLGASAPPLPVAALEARKELLSTVAAMLAQAVALRRERRRFEEEASRLRAAGEASVRPEQMVGNSRAMRSVFEMVGRVAGSDATVLIDGESGVGKELIAQAIHTNSGRAAQPFVRVNCAALSQSLLESELFGHEQGAFTGALKRRKGRFELAHGGSIFLDEIGDIPPTTQVMLLRVLQERQIERVGGTVTVDVDVRVIVATNRDLPQLVAEGTFREDLYYRLDVFPIHVPPLRKRRTDIPQLADYFAERFGRANSKPIRRIATSAIDMLMAYHWPGNVRELENCIERAVLMSDDGVIHGHHLPPTLQTAEATGTGRVDEGLDATLDRIERDLLTDALKQARGNMAEAARALAISERKIGLRVRKHRIDYRRFRQRG